jgi:cyclophilin family peptidyl-prolyl cis-trans isomerase
MERGANNYNPNNNNNSNYNPNNYYNKANNINAANNNYNNMNTNNMNNNNNNRNPRVYLDISIGGGAARRMEFELDMERTPGTATNFRRLCEGACDGRLSYRGSRFHRIIPGFVCHGGDLTRGDGTGGHSAFHGRRCFADESFEVRHDAAGVLSMANSGRDSNSSQFFVTAGPAPWLDGRHVAFGRLVAGFDVLKAIDAVGTPVNGKPKADVRIVACGVLPHS